jgi:hypothetical protein
MISTAWYKTKALVSWAQKLQLNLINNNNNKKKVAAESQVNTTPMLQDIRE